ncbi:MAG TPA: sialidase family protein [Thermoleophilaceae bacterium]
MKLSRRWTAAFVGALALTAVLAGAAGAGAAVPLTKISADPFTNPTSQHATEVEPDTFAHHGTVVSTFQVGRFFDGGATDIGAVRSGDGGTTWDAPTFLPAQTFSADAPFGDPNSPFERTSDPTVAFDAAHNVWMISSIPLLPNTSVPTVFISRSTDDGLTWGRPISIPPPDAKNVDLDKNWTVCDNHSESSPFFGHCYTEFDNFGEGDRVLMSTSTDGGLTWSIPTETAGHDKGLGGQPVVQPDGTVIVPFEALNGKIEAFRSTNGGASWTKAVTVGNIRFHGVAGNLRTSPLPSAEIAADGTAFVAWEDCRFRRRCSSNDIVFSRSSDGVNWTDAARVPIDDVTSGADHFIPGLGVDPAASGDDSHLALTYYFYPDATCTGGCQLKAGYISSPNGGATWSAPIELTNPMSLNDIAQTSQGPMVGDYISTSISGGTATTVVAVGLPHTGTTFDEGMYAPTSKLPIATAAQATRPSSTAGAGPITGEGTGETHHALKRD